MSFEQDKDKDKQRDRNLPPRSPAASSSYSSSYRSRSPGQRDLMSPSRHNHHSPSHINSNRYQHQESPLRRSRNESHSRSRSPRPRYRNDGHDPRSHHPYHHHSYRDQRESDRFGHDSYRDKSDRNRPTGSAYRSKSPEPGFRRPRTPVLTSQHYQPTRDDRDSSGRDKRYPSPPRHRHGEEGRRERSPIAYAHKHDRSHVSAKDEHPSRDQGEEKKSLTSILVSSLTPNVTTPHLQEIFSFYGTIASIKIPINPQSGLTRGIAYIHYATEQDALNAVTHMDKGQIDGNVVRVEQKMGMPQRIIPSH